MKRYIKFAFIAVTVLMFASCEQETQPTYPNGELPIHHGYMQFSTEVSTRSDLATNMRGRDFGVLGYSYSYTTDWDAARSLATPDIFYDLEVSCNANGVCTYDNDGNAIPVTFNAGDKIKFVKSSIDGVVMEPSGSHIIYSIPRVLTDNGDVIYEYYLNYLVLVRLVFFLNQLIDYLIFLFCIHILLLCFLLHLFCLIIPFQMP